MNDNRTKVSVRRDWMDYASLASNAVQNFQLAEIQSFLVESQNREVRKEEDARRFRAQLFDLEDSLDNYSGWLAKDLTILNSGPAVQPDDAVPNARTSAESNVRGLVRLLIRAKSLGAENRSMSYEDKDRHRTLLKRICDEITKAEICIGADRVAKITDDTEKAHGYLTFLEPTEKLIAYLKTRESIGIKITELNNLYENPPWGLEQKKDQRVGGFILGSIGAVFLGLAAICFVTIFLSNGDQSINDEHLRPAFLCLLVGGPLFGFGLWTRRNRPEWSGVRDYEARIDEHKRQIQVLEAEVPDAETQELYLIIKPHYSSLDEIIYAYREVIAFVNTAGHIKYEPKF